MRVGVLLFHAVSELDVVGPIAVLNAAKRFLEDPEALEVSTVARSRFSVQTTAGLTLTPGWAFASAPDYEVLIVPGGAGVRKASRDKAVQAFLDAQRAHLQVLASVSSGALLLGDLGFLRDQKVTSHPEVREELEAFEVALVSDDRLVMNPTGIWCAGGMTAGIDLALALLDYRFGPELAEKVAAFISYPYRAVAS
ncbi:MAG: DJ-1/PfpI family protein [Trueperaceae bacterium]|nr:MAG: DJ-1/PfpI family protein [Trueperaceae bacterium]